ncbi:MAG: [FeFe] hydrogenase H-cluster maturation GTPase HydF [Tyzzerella sp.]|uniref:[FeFe] hydrogenase H-cluster maturation GTPase HydF n=1 Tax=Candidatus Fimicola merdigallinarum TaxID=2840819 RepID=A0A9D9H3I9_9FIRM|nr:[FeFe] hydrogenase H-cluster maturation GTPase HydF [Candidatus Fimicola merdigallinarum]
MSMSETPRGERVHIAFFGRRNAGKSSLLNAVTGQNLSVVSNVKGTTTDPVYKAMELLPIGPVVVIDTPGIDDVGELGELRVKKAKEVLKKTDIAIVVVENELGDFENKLLDDIKNRNLPYIIVYTKSDIYGDRVLGENEIAVSSVENKGINELKEMIGKFNVNKNEKTLISHMLDKGDIVVLVVPIDKSAPKGRLILPQQQVIRDCLDCGAVALVCKDTELRDIIDKFSDNIKLVVTDSQIFPFVDKVTPENILMTSFSVLFARYKGNIGQAVRGAKKLNEINDSSRILISEGCTHHRQCGDIGTEKLPNLVRKFTGSNPSFEFTSGTEFPENLSDYDLVIHCGGCMINEKEMANRLRVAEGQDIPMTNYGTAIAYMTGILERSLKPFNVLSGEVYL